MQVRIPNVAKFNIPATFFVQECYRQCELTTVPLNWMHHSLSESHFPLMQFFLQEAGLLGSVRHCSARVRAAVWPSSKNKIIGVRQHLHVSTRLSAFCAPPLPASLTQHHRCSHQHNKLYQKRCVATTSISGTSANDSRLRPHTRPFKGLFAPTFDMRPAAGCTGSHTHITGVRGLH